MAGPLLPVDPTATTPGVVTGSPTGTTEVPASSTTVPEDESVPWPFNDNLLCFSRRDHRQQRTAQQGSYTDKLPHRYSPCKIDARSRRLHCAFIPFPGSPQTAYARCRWISIRLADDCARKVCAKRIESPNDV